MTQKIEPVYVSFEQAKKLKEKGFDVPCKQRFWVGFENEEHFQDGCISNNCNDYDDSSTVYYSAPEQHQVVEWLRINHGIWIYVKLGYGHEYVIQSTNAPFTFIYSDGTFESPQEAYSAAFDYILNNDLI